MQWIAAERQQPRARITGAIYLLYFLTAISAERISHRSAVYGEVGNVIANAFYIAVTLLFYSLFKPVNRGVSLLAAFFSVVGCTIATVGLFHPTPSYLNPLLFFGPYCILIGYLIFRSAFLPRILGLLMTLAGFGWLIYLLPSAKHLSTYLEILGIVAEGSLCLWLVVMGVNAPRWREQASAAGERP